MFTYIGPSVSTNWPCNNQAITSTGGTSTAVDISGAEGPIIISVAVASGGTNSMAIAVTQSTTLGGTYTAVPAANLLNASGVASTFAAVSTAGSIQTLFLNRVNSEEFIALSFTGGTLTQTVSATISFIQKYITL